MSTGSTQTTIEGEQLREEPERPDHVNGIAAVLWEVGADDRVGDDDELGEVYERCVERGLIEEASE